MSIYELYLKKQRNFFFLAKLKFFSGDESQERKANALQKQTTLIADNEDIEVRQTINILTDFAGFDQFFKKIIIGKLIFVF